MTKTNNIEPYNEPQEERTYELEEAYLQAKKHVDEIKGFYGHLVAYLAVNLFISIAKITSDMNNGGTFSEAFFDFGTFAVWLFWGIGIFFHGLGVFGKNLFFSKDWEKKQIKKFMNEGDTKRWN